MNSSPTPPVRCPGCIKGIGMCKTRPCWGTPDDIEKLIATGHANSMWLDHWVGDGPNDDNIEIVSPAARGDEKDYAPFQPRGRCTLLTEDDRCSVYDMQPMEGAGACCKLDRDDLHREVAMTWNNERGRELVARWKAAMGIGWGPPEPASLFDMLF